MGLGQELLDAARTGNKMTVEKIVGQMMNKRSGPFSSIRRWPSVNVKDDDGYTPLHYASLHGHRDIVEKLLSADASPCVVDKKGATPLHLATFNGHTEIVYMLLAHATQPVNIDQKTHKHETALLIAAQFGFNDIVTQLIAKGADVTIKNLNDMNALDLAAHFDRKEVLKHLLRVRPQLIDQYRSPVRDGVIFKHTPLHRAAMNGRKQVVKELLAAGVDPNIRTESGTALHEAACYARDSVARVLLRRGADLKARDLDGRTVFDLLADFPEESTRKVREVIREFMSQRCSYDSDEDLPPFPVPGSPPAVMCITACTYMSHDAHSNDKIVTNDASPPISIEPPSPSDKSNVNSDSRLIRTDSILSQQKLAKNMVPFDEIQSGSKVLMIHHEVMSELKSLNEIQNKTPLVKTKTMMEKAIFENVVTKWPELDHDREPHVSYGMAENEYYKAEKADKINGIKGLATAKPEIHHEKGQFHDATINEAKPIKTVTSQNDFVGIKYSHNSGEDLNLRRETKENEVKIIKQTTDQTAHLKDNFITSLKKVYSHNDFNRFDKSPIIDREPKVRRETMDSQFDKAKRTYDQNPFNSLKNTPRPKLTCLQNPSSETIDIESIESNHEQYVRRATLEKELKIKLNNGQPYNNNHPKTTSPNLDHDPRFRRGTINKEYIKGQTNCEKTYNQNHNFGHVQHFGRGTIDKEYNKMNTVNDQKYNHNPKFDHDQRFRRGTMDKEYNKVKKSNDQTYYQNLTLDHDQRFRRGTMDKEYIKVKTANNQSYNQNSNFDHVQRFRCKTMDKECVKVETTNEQKFYQNHELNHGQRFTNEKAEKEYCNIDTNYGQAFNQKSQSPKFDYDQRFGRDTTKNKCEVTSNPCIQTDSNTNKKKPRPLPKPKITINNQKLNQYSPNPYFETNVFENAESLPHLIYEDVSDLNLPDDIKANMSIRQEVESQPLYLDMGSARKDLRQRLFSDCMPLLDHNMTGRYFEDPSMSTDAKPVRQGLRKRFSSECKSPNDTNIVMSSIRNQSLYMDMRPVRRDLRKRYSSDYTNLPGALKAHMFGLQEFENQPLYLEMRPLRRSFRKRFISDYAPPPKINRVSSLSYYDINYDELDSFYKKELSRVRSIPDCFMHLGAKTMHVRGDPGCLYEQYDYLYFDVINPRALREDVHPFIKTKHKATPMPCYCQDLAVFGDEIEQSKFYSCENLDDENIDDSAVYSTVDQIEYFNKHDGDSSSSQTDSSNDSTDQTPPPLERKLTVILKRKAFLLKQLVTEWTAPETQGISNKNESFITPSSSVTKIHPQSFVKKLASKCLGLKAKFNSAPNINSTGTEAEVDVGSKRSDHKIIGNSKFFKILSKKEESGEINCNDEFDTISLDRLGTLNRDSVVNRSNRSCPGFKTSLPNISENNELSDHESFTESVINTVVNCDMDVKNKAINEALNTNLNIFEPRERFSIISNVSFGSATLLNECYESYEFDETKPKNNTMPRPIPRPVVSNTSHDNSIYENVTNIKPTPAARTHIPIKLPLDEVGKKVLYENITLLRDKKPEPPKRTLFPSQIRYESLERNSTLSVSSSSTVSSDSMVDESNLEDILLSAKSKSFRHGQVASFYSELNKSSASRTKSNASDSSESSDMSAIENVDCSDDVEHNIQADDDKALYLSMTGTLPNNKTESKESKKVLFRHKTFTNMEIDRNSTKVKDLPLWNNEFLKETLAHYHIRGTGHCIYNAPTVQEFMYIFNRDTLYKDVPPFIKVPNDKRDSYYETAICFCKPRPPKHHNSAEDLLERVPQEEEKVSIDTEALKNRREIFSSSFKCFCVSGTCKFHSNRRETLGDLIVKFSAIKKSISTPDITLDNSPYSTAAKSKLPKNMSVPRNLEEPYAVVTIEDIIERKNENERTDERGYSIMSHPSTLSSNSSARPYSIKDIAEVISLNRSTSTASAASNASDVCLPVRKSSSSEYSGHWSLQSCNSNVTIKSDLSFKSCLEASSEDSDGTLHSDDNSDAETIKSDVSTAKRPWVHSDSFRFGGNSKPEIETIAEENYSSFEDSKLETMSSKFESGISVEGSVSSSSGGEDDSGIPGGESCVSLGASLERGSVTGGVRSGSGRRRWDEEGTSEGDALSVSSAASSCAPLHLLHHHDYTKVSPTPPKKPPRRNLSVSPTHANSPSSGYSYELRAHARSQDYLDDIQGAKLYLKHGRSVDHYENKLSYSEYEDNRIPNPPIPNPRPSLKQRQQPVAITAMYENVAIKQQNPRRKLRRNVDNESMNDRVRKYSNQERSSLESLLDDQSMNSPSDCERYYEGSRVETPMSPSHYIQPPTPDHPPPSAKQAENSIHERIRPLSQEYKRRSALRDSYTETDGNLLRVASAASVASGATDRSGNTDNCVEEYVCDMPFAGLFKGSTTTLDGIGLRPMPAERPKTLRKLKSVYDCSPTEPQALNNGVDRSFNGEEEVRRRSNTTSSNHSTDKSLSILSPFDEQEEWAKISEIMASFGSKLVRESVFVSELEQEFTSRLGLSCSESSLSPSVASNLGLWLAGIGLHDYESLFLEGGYDDIEFVNGVLDENDLRELGIEENDRQKILESAKQLPLKIAEISNNHNNNNISNKHQNESVDEWLRQINLEQYSDTFRKHLYVDMDRVRRIWEVELTAVLEINKAGHRKRILASVSGEQNGPINSHMEDINADLNSLKNNIQQLKEEIKEKIPISENLKPVPPPVVPTLIPPGGETLKRSKKNRPAPQPPRPSDLEIRAPSELMVGQAGNMKPQWRHQPFVLVTGAITYVANYLGSTVVKELKGTESTKKSIQKLKKTKEPRDSPDIILSISYRGVKFLNTITRELVCEHEIRNIHCACQDADDLTHFAYITKDHTTRSHYCHVFKVATMDQATEVILTLGEAFEVAYQMVLREQSNRTRVTQTLAKTPTHDPTTHPMTKEKSVNHGRSHSITEIKLNGHQLKIAPLPSSLSNEDFQAARGSDGSRSPRTPLLKAPIASTEEL